MRIAHLVLLLFAADAPAAAEAKPAPAAPPAAPCPPTTYAEARRLVEDGGKVILLVRKPATMTRLPTKLGWRTVVCDDAPLAPGRYDCETVKGQPCLTQVEAYLPVPQDAESWRWLLAPPGCTTSR